MTLIAHGVEEVNEEFRFIKSHTGFRYVFVHPGCEVGLDDGQTLPVLSVSSDSVLVQDGEEKEQTNAFDYAMSVLLHPHMFAEGSFSFVPGPGPYKVGLCDNCHKEDQPVEPGYDLFDVHVVDVCVMGCQPLRNMKAYYAIREVM